METDQRPPGLDPVHAALRRLVAGMMGPIAAGGAARAYELTEMLNVLLGLDLPPDTVVRSPTPDALARSLMTAWFEDGNSVEDLLERLTALAEDD